MKILKHIVNAVVWTFLGLYLLIILLLHIPSVQQLTGRKVASLASEHLGTRVEIGRVDLGFFNRLIVDDVLIYDQQQKEMIRAARLSVKIDLLALADSRYHIRTAQVFGAHCQFYQAAEGAQPNFQFLVDSLSSKDTTAHTPLDLRINSLIIRRSSVSYDRFDVAPTPHKLNPSHLHLHDISAYILLHTLTDDSLDINVKRLALKEQSGLQVDRLAFRFGGGRRGSHLEEFVLQMPNTEMAIDNIHAAYRMQGDSIDMASLRYEGRMPQSVVTPSDVACLLPSLATFTDPLTLASRFRGRSTSLYLESLDIESPTGDLNVALSGELHHLDQTPTWQTDIRRLNLSEKTVGFISENLQGERIDVPTVVSRLGDIRLTGTATGTGLHTVDTRCTVQTGVGSLGLDFSLRPDQRFTGHVDTKGINLGRLTDDDRMGELATAVDISGRLGGADGPSLQADGLVSRLEYNGYQYRNIDIDALYSREGISGRLSIDDPNIALTAEGALLQAGKEKNVRLVATLATLAPQALHLSERWRDARFSGRLNADFTASSVNDARGELNIEDFRMQGESGDYALDALQVTSGYEDQLHYLTLSSDFASARLTGRFDYATLGQSLVNFVGSKLPTLPGLPKVTRQTNNDFELRASIVKSDWAEKLFGVPLDLQKIAYISAHVNDAEKQISVNCDLPAFSYAGSGYRRGRISITSPGDTLHASIGITKLMDDDTRLDLQATVDAIDNQMATSLTWDNHEKERVSGQLNATGTVFTDEQGQQTAQIHVQPSHLNINNAIWNVAPSDIVYTQQRIGIDHFAVEHDAQHIFVSGTASATAADSITIDLQDVDVNYVLDLVNFHSVEFGGLASGQAVVKAPFGELAAHADLTVKKFLFEEGRMGVLGAHVDWNQEEKQIDIRAVANDGPDAMTYINGYVSPSKDYIDLNIRAAGTHLDFMHSFTKSFVSHVEGHGEGELRLAGPLSEINLTGQLVVNGEATIRPLGCTYQLRNDTIVMVPDEIELDRIPFYDRQGNRGYLSGAIHHKHLTRLTYDLYMDADNLLAYDFRDFGDDTFYGTVYATGSVGIHGRSGEVVIDIDVTPQRNSSFVYNASTADVVADQQFITWGEAIEQQQPTVEAAAPWQQEEKSVRTQEEPVDVPTDIHLNFLINCTPEATLRLLMDSRTNDYITLNGSGVVRATYYNKGAFNMFGTYTVSEGTYGLTIQNIIKKNFNFAGGGTIVFGGDPYEATLNLQAVHTVNGVSLSDLNIGNSFTNNTVRVNCLMNIQGQPASPRVTFDLDMPTVGSDEKQLIRSIINNEEEMNQQVLYLLGIGRFYPQQANNYDMENARQQSQTSLAMQGLLSGTLSSQINSLLNTVVNSSNWNFGANISTGDEGWNNAEYEGLISGRLLNNRLLLNGQFGYRDNTTKATPSFIGDFDIQYLLYPNGNLAIKVYNQTNDRYFTKSSLNTQGLGLIMKRDFSSFRDLFGSRRKHADSLSVGRQ